MSKNVDATIVHLRTNFLSLILDFSLGQIPRVAYWGTPLEDETTNTLRSLVEATRIAPEGNSPDEPRAVGLIPLESDGWKGRPGLVGWRPEGIGWAPRFALDTILWDGAASPQTNDASVVLSGAGELKITLRDVHTELTLRIFIDALEEGPVRFRAEIENEAQSPYFLEELAIVLPLPLEANEILDTTGRWGKERHAQRRPVVLGCDLRESRHGRPGFDSPGITFVGVNGFSYRRGELWCLHTAYSGNSRSWVEKLPTGQQVFGGSELLLPGEISLSDGESYTTPWIYGLHAEGLDAAANQVHSWLRSRPNHPRSPRPVTLNVWEAVYFRHDEDELRRLAEIAASIGVERYVLDDGWFLNRRTDKMGLGDWYVDPQVWPHGLEALTSHVHDLGMQFGLWFEPEMVNPDSNLAREHPEWLMAAQGGSDTHDLPLLWRHQQVLNLSIPQAREYIEARIVQLVQTLGIDYIKWDHNRDLIEAGDLTAGGRAAVHAQTQAVYRLLEDIKRKCPNLEIESCASGGGRIDWEIIQRTDRVWVSDCIDPVERQEMVQQLIQMLPFELMGTHVASPVSHTTGRTASLSARAATAMWGHFGIEWDISSLSKTELSQLAAWVEFYKNQRQLLHSGDVVRCLTPDPSLWLTGVVSSDRTRALFSLVSRKRAPIAPLGRLRFSGLDPKKLYRLRPRIVTNPPEGLTTPNWFGKSKESDGKDFDGTVMTGQALEKSGVAAPRLFPEQVLLIELTEEYDVVEGAENNGYREILPIHGPLPQ